MSNWKLFDEELPRTMQPIWAANNAHRGSAALAIFFGPQKGVVFLEEDAIYGLEPTHWHGVKFPGAVPRKKKTQATASREAGENKD